MAERGGFLLAAAAVVVAGVWLSTSATGKAKAMGQLKLASQHGERAAAGTLGSTQIRNGVTPQAWVPYCPPGAHYGRHRMYHHPANSSPNFSRMTTAANAYDWVFAPPSEMDL